MEMGANAPGFIRFRLPVLESTKGNGHSKTGNERGKVKIWVEVRWYILHKYLWPSFVLLAQASPKGEDHEQASQKSHAHETQKTWR